jgi:hypothetical protein
MAKKYRVYVSKADVMEDEDFWWIILLKPSDMVEKVVERMTQPRE